MNTETGVVASRETLKQLAMERNTAFVSSFVPIDPASLSPRAQAQLQSAGVTVLSRNSRCPCGSSKRFKRCCMTK